MKTTKPIFFLLLATALITCKKWDNPYDPNADADAKAKITTPTVFTDSIRDITKTSAICDANIVSDGYSSVTDKGICWNMSGKPTVGDNKSQQGAGKGNFSCFLSNLMEGKTYYIKAFATNSKGTAYGNELSFKTSAIIINLPTLTTTSISAITQTTATSGGNITNDGGAAITTRGICWGTASNPTIDLTTKTSNASDSVSFACNLTGLTANTTYYVRAYATNSKGTAYGNEVSFVTTSIDINLPTLITTAISAITQTTATSGGNVSNDGGATITVRGVCWSTSTNPTIDLSTKTSNASGKGSFTSNLTGLTAGTKYYLKAYATNSAGTAYGSEVSFTTTANIINGNVSDNDGNTYKTVVIGTQTWMAENLKTTKYNDGTAIPNVTNNAAWAALATPAYCWYNNDAATYKTTYGALYNWYTINTGKLCPTGWHVPTDAEWSTLTTYLGGESVAGGKLKELGTTHWTSPNAGASNSSGFTALPGGRRDSNGAFSSIGGNGDWWSSSEHSASNAWGRGVNFGNSPAYKGSSYKSYGFSVRCLKD